jgi:hypothetical protein
LYLTQQKLTRKLPDAEARRIAAKPELLRK